MHCTSRTPILLGVKDLKDPGLFWRHIAGIVPLLIWVVCQVRHFVSRSSLTVEVVLVPFLEFLVLRYIAILAGTWRWQVRNDCAQVLFVE